MKAPSVAGKLKRDLRRLFAIKEGNNDKVKEAKAYLKFMDKGVPEGHGQSAYQNWY